MFEPSLCAHCHKPRGTRPRYCSDECAAAVASERDRLRAGERKAAVNARHRSEWAAAKAAADAYMRSVKLAAPGSDPQQIAQIATTLDGPLPG